MTPEAKLISLGVRQLSPAADALPPPLKFILEPWSEIVFDGGEEWLIKRVLPRRGLAAIYGKPGSFKSFVAVHIAMCIALGREWAGRRVAQASVVYIGAEGAAGLRKRKAGYVKAWRDLPEQVGFSLVSAAPNLGSDPGDLPELVRAIEGSRIAPGLIVVDTLAKTLGSAEENGAGMTAFVANVGALGQQFDCLVLAVHHVGLGDEAQKRMRGHSSFHGALDAQILSERREGENTATLTLQKLKDDVSDVRLAAQLSRVVVGLDEDNEEISTLIVDEVLDAGVVSSAPRGKLVPPSQRLLSDIIVQALDEAGEAFQVGGQPVRVVHDERVRERYYAAIAEQADASDDPDKLAERQRRAFNRAVAAELKTKRLTAKASAGRRLLWLP
jgi:RecA/RadA recombinase